MSITTRAAQRPYDAVIIGAGAAGLSIAYELARAGARVAVVEREQPGSGASGAAAGMLAAQHEADGNTPFFRLCVAARDAYPAWVKQLEAESGIDVELVQSGIVDLARDEHEAASLLERRRWQRDAGQPCEWWEPERVERELPGVRGIAGALYYPRDGHLRPPRLTQALAAACRRAGVDLRVGVTALALHTAAGRVAGVETDDGTFLAQATVLAAGADTGRLAAGWGVALPVHPVKGQILAVVPPPSLGGPWLQRLTPVFAPGVYLVPKRDGTVVVGATVEPEAGFDRRVTLAAVTQLGGAAGAILPAITHAEVHQLWT
ncbi:MAG TPA: FAD-dependent oxidoreductase, partial [Bacillota bacterium]